jgi:alpha-beta hydrolase superfamily lysophospholipase
MNFLFKDESFSFEALRTAGHIPDGGADLGEVLSTAARIPDRDVLAWEREWAATADRVARIGEQARDAGARVSAREAFLRASSYYRTAEFFRRDDPADDPKVEHLSGRATATFIAATALMESPVERVSIPYETTSLPGYLFLVDGSGSPRPTIIFTGGFDSTCEEAYFVAAAAAMRRGYNVLAFDGPGQGAVLRQQGLAFRPDWEAVITPVVDFLLERREVDPERLSLIGYSLGGLLAARAAAFERRLAAIALYDGMYSFNDVCRRAIPAFLGRIIDAHGDRLLASLFALLARRSVKLAWGFGNGKWTFGADTVSEYVRRLEPYTLDEVIDRIACPTLVMDGENDHFQAGEAQRVYDGLTCPKSLVVFAGAEGAGEHCQVGAMRLFQQRYLDWLDATMSTTARVAA